MAASSTNMGLNEDSTFAQRILDLITALLTDTKKKFSKYDPIMHIVTERSTEEKEILRNLDGAHVLIDELKMRLNSLNDEQFVQVDGMRQDNTELVLVLDALQFKVREMKEQFRQHRATFAEQGWQTEQLFCSFYRENLDF